MKEILVRTLYVFTILLFFTGSGVSSWDHKTLVSINRVTAQYILGSFEFAPLEVTRLGEFDNLRSEGCLLSYDVGHPRIPLKTALILLPYGTTYGGIQLRSIKKEEVPGRFNVQLVSPAVPILGGKAKREFMNIQAGLYPREVIRVGPCLCLGGYRVLTLTAFCAQFHPSLGKLIQIQRMEFAISLEPKKALDRGRPWSISGDVVQGLVVNPETIWTYPVSRTGKERYLIITNEALREAFEDLRASKEEKGFVSEIVTLSEIYNTYEGKDKQEKIRNYIMAVRPNYVLLGGDSDVVPHRGVYARVEGAVLRGDPIEDFHIPCDLYYACLQGNWDGDEDGVFGEPEDGVDLAPDVFVGRAPVNTPDEAESFVKKTLLFEGGGEEVLRKVLLVGCRLDSLNDGAECIREIVRLIPPGYEKYEFYETGVGVEKIEVIRLLNQGVGIGIHVGHANEAFISPILTQNDVIDLTNHKTPFLFNTTGCFAGAFDKSEAIGEELILNPKGGASAFIGNSRYGLYDETSPLLYSGEFQREFFKVLLREGVHQAGKALAISKLRFAPLSDDASPYRWIQYCLNLLGDPEMTFSTIKEIQVVNYTLANGELIEPAVDLPLILTLINLRDQEALEVKARIKTSDIYTDLLRDTSSFGNIAPGEVKDNRDTPYLIRFSPVCPKEHSILFRLEIAAGGGSDYEHTDYFTVSISLLSEELENILIYPNPCRYGEVVKIANIPLDSDPTITIYDVSGNVVKRLYEGAGIVWRKGSGMGRWDLCHKDGGGVVSSGIYLCVVRCDLGVWKGKIAVIK